MAEPAPLECHSLWLLPAEPAGSACARAIFELAWALGGPTFLPHLTLLGGMTRPPAELGEKVRALAAELAPLTVPLKGAAVFDEEFRALVLEAEPTAALRAAHQRAAALLGEGLAGPFLPHLSLYYGRAPAPRRWEALSARREALPGQLRVERLGLFRTGPEVARWVRVGELALEGR